jgi:hypothetical protein
MKNCGKKAREIGKRNFKYSSDDDEDDEDGERYRIDPSVQMYKTVNFHKNGKQNETSTQAEAKCSKNDELIKKPLLNRFQDKISDDDSINRRILEVTSNTIPTVLGENPNMIKDDHIKSRRSSFQLLNKPMFSEDEIHVDYKRDSETKQQEQVDYETVKLKQSLEELQHKNMQLEHQIKLSQEETHQLLARERSERMNIVAQIEQEHKKITQKLLGLFLYYRAIVLLLCLIHAFSRMMGNYFNALSNDFKDDHEKAAKELLAEKNHLRSALREMEQTKNNMTEHLHETEAQANQERMLLEQK